MIKLGHTRLDLCAPLDCALSPQFLLVDVNVSLQVSSFAWNNFLLLLLLLSALK
jgi:hypothetical protein